MTVSAGLLSPQDFLLGVTELVHSAAEYNKLAPTHHYELVDIKALPLPDRAYCATDASYLRLNSGLVEVFYSPSFQVPVFYLSPDFIQSSIVQGVGFNAMITFTEHPVTGLPSCYLHPCRTATIMEELRPATPLDYLKKWLGAHQNLLPPPYGPVLPAEFFKSNK